MIGIEDNCAGIANTQNTAKNKKPNNDQINRNTVKTLDGVFIYLYLVYIDSFDNTSSKEIVMADAKNWLTDVMVEARKYPGVADSHSDHAKIEISFPMKTATIRPSLDVFQTRAVVKLHFDHPYEMIEFAEEFLEAAKNAKTLN